MGSGDIPARAPFGYGVQIKVSPDANARAPRRPAGCRDLTHHGRTATTRLRAAVKSAVGSRKVLDLCGCIRACAAATGRRPTSS